MNTTPNLGKIKHGIKTRKPMLKSQSFWVTQVTVLVIAAAHELLERFGYFVGSPMDVVMSLFWIPLVYMALTFGMAGAIITSILIVLASIPNWVNMELASQRLEEIFIVFITVAISSLIGLQVDRRHEAKRDAEVYAAYAVRSQEEERKQLSLDLHDDSIQALISVCHELDTLKNIPSSSQRSLNDIRSSVAGVIQGLRDLIKGLRPPVLDDIGVASALRDLLADFSEKGMFTGELDIRGEQRRLPPDIELALFRIAQEAMQNIGRHAKANRVHVVISFGTKQVALDVIDDGIGFDALAFQERSRCHIGVLGMRERAEMAGGRFELSTKPGKGTRVTACLPIP